MERVEDVIMEDMEVSRPQEEDLADTEDPLRLVLLTQEPVVHPIIIEIREAHRPTDTAIKAHEN
jgi:hypothetical protein